MMFGSGFELVSSSSAKAKKEDENLIPIEPQDLIDIFLNQKNISFGPSAKTEVRLSVEYNAFGLSKKLSKDNLPILNPELRRYKIIQDEKGKLFNHELSAFSDCLTNISNLGSKRQIGESESVKEAAVILKFRIGNDLYQRWWKEFALTIAFGLRIKIIKRGITEDGKPAKLVHTFECSYGNIAFDDLHNDNKDKNGIMSPTRVLSFDSKIVLKDDITLYFTVNCSSFSIVFDE
jgi:hypothetical protein